MGKLAGEVVTDETRREMTEFVEGDGLKELLANASDKEKLEKEIALAKSLKSTYKKHSKLANWVFGVKNKGGNPAENINNIMDKFVVEEDDEEGKYRKKTFMEYLGEEDSKNPFKKLWQGIKHPFKFAGYILGARYVKKMIAGKEVMILAGKAKEAGAKLAEKGKDIGKKAVAAKNTMKEVSRSKEFLYVKNVLTSTMKNMSGNLKTLFLKIRSGKITNPKEIAKLKEMAVGKSGKNLTKLAQKYPDEMAKLAPKFKLIPRVSVKGMVYFSLGRLAFDWMKGGENFEKKQAVWETAKVVPFLGTILESYDAVNGDSSWKEVALSAGIDAATLATGGWAAIARLAKAGKAMKAIKAVRTVKKVQIARTALQGSKNAAKGIVKGMSTRGLIGLGFGAIYNQLFPDGKIVEVATGFAEDEFKKKYPVEFGNMKLLQEAEKDLF